MNKVSDNPSEGAGQEEQTIPDRKCDIVMKGGITSGVVYPNALYNLSRHFKFKNIAGTSAGAIAAALGAAAEYGRSHGTDRFNRLGKLGEWLGGKEPGTPGTRMLSLFQPSETLRPLYLVFLALASKRSTVTKICSLIWIILFRSRPWAWLGMLPAIALATITIYLIHDEADAALKRGLLLLVIYGLVMIPAYRAVKGLAAITFTGVMIWLVVYGLGSLEPFAFGLKPAARQWILPLSALYLLLIAGFGMGTVFLLERLLRGHIPQNMYGMCTGMPSQTTPATGTSDAPPALTPWLHARIQELAGRGESDEPLTFGELRQDADINLRVMTTALTFGRPYLLPFSKGSFYFDPAEFRRLFPQDVVDFLETKSRELVQQSSNERFIQHAMHMLPRMPLPRDDDLPVLIAVRMSLSFPVLLSAVPLWDYNWKEGANFKAREELGQWFAKQKEHGQRLSWAEIYRNGEWPDGAPSSRMVPRRVWFSDGGICSNFPVHLFDRLIPRWPTLAINLRYHNVDKINEEDRATLAQRNNDNLDESWTPIDRADGSGSLFRFVGAILDTMQNWSDNGQLKVPGFRDRIAHVNMKTDEGGLNLDMSESQIETLTRSGEQAAERLVERFVQAPDPEDPNALSWDSHRWTRFRSSMALLQTQLESLVGTYTDPDQDPHYEDMIRRGKNQTPTCYPWSKDEQKELALNVMQSFEEVAALLKESEVGLNDERTPKPTPELRIQPKL